MFKMKTTPKVVSLWSRVLQKAVSYFLDLNKIFLISSLKSVINTEVTAMNVFRKSIVDSFLGVISSRIPNLIAKKKARLFLRIELLSHLQGSVKPLLSIYLMDKNIIAQNSKKGNDENI
ncbi:Uncharacterised protein [Campylobacter jejuni subsp. doylei]|uniref:Uncharacterized protein n=1 Tax=Campylobacter jejuni subsp. doylei TaxID=32021 RepID=A0A448J6C8_CAMJU|nr:hypothetical protein [Campylobacter jejuni]VEG60244.1 Uncharacterised protein [Campylobacter jejuni subsp. doylei]